MAQSGGDEVQSSVAELLWSRLCIGMLLAALPGISSGLCSKHAAVPPDNPMGSLHFYSSELKKKAHFEALFSHLLIPCQRAG